METTSTTRIALKWSIISSVVGIIVGTLINMTDMWQKPGITVLAILPTAVFIWLAMKEFRKENNDAMSYGQGINIGLIMGAVGGLLGGIWNYIYTNFIDTTYMERVQDFQIENFEKSGMGDEQIEQAIEMSSKFQSGGFIFLFAVLGSIFITFLISLVVAAIVKKEKTIF